MKDELHKLNLDSVKAFADSYPSPLAIMKPFENNGTITDFIYEYVNEEAAVSANMQRELLVGKGLLDIFPLCKSNGIFENLKEVYLTGVPWSKSINYECSSDRSTVPDYYLINAIKIHNSIIMGWVEFTHIKIGDSLRESEEKLFQLLAEKELLLKEKEILKKEAHHRIKNSLQIVNSLIRLHISDRDYADKDFFRVIENKIHSISLLHEHLYRNTTFSRLRLDSYIHDLLRHIVHSYAPGNIEIITELEEIEFETEKAINTGLIVNELVTNAIMHAFNGHVNQAICIKLFRTNEDKICLYVSDNGRGLDPGFNMNDSKGLGLQLVQTLTDQLSGIMTVVSAGGTTFEIIL